MTRFPDRIRASRCWLPFLALLAALSIWTATPAVAAPFQPPTLDRHVVDGAGALSETQKAELHARLAEFRRATGYAVVALIVPSLEDRNIEDVAYETFNSWKIGDEGKDNGVLLVLAVSEKRSRIETGKGVGGELTDLESVEILRQHVTPALRDGDVYRAVDGGTRGIQASLVDGAPGAVKPDADPHQQPAPWYTKWALLGGLLLVGLLAIVSPTFRGILFMLLQMFIFARGGGGGRGSFGGGGLGGGGYSGGGGRSGGGGASDG